MTLLQVKVVLLAAKLGSVSLAAKELGISQSNASNYIKDIETELGVPLLIRNRKGVIPTEKGTEFLEHAKRMIDENDSILKISKNSHHYRLRVAAMNYSVAFDAFLKVCEEQKDNSNTDLQYHNVSLETGLEMLKNYKTDVLIAVLRKDNIESADWFSKTSDLNRQYVKEIQFYVRCRKDHPISKNPSFQNGTFSVDELKPYPYVDYVSFNRVSEVPAIDDKSYMHCSSKIIVDGKYNRFSIMQHTDAYSLGTKPSDRILQEYNLTIYPVPGLIGDMCIFTRKNEENKQEIKRYIDLIYEGIKQ